MYSISIAGTSGSGKTSLIQTLKMYLNESVFSHLDLDGYQIHNRAERAIINTFPEDITEDDIDRIINDINTLASGQDIMMPKYDHVLGEVTEYISLKPKKILIIEGLHAIMLNGFLAGNGIDLKIYMNTSQDIQRAWKVKRDVETRGYSYNNVLKEIENRTVFEELYVKSQVDYADVLVDTRIRSGELIREILLASDFIHNIDYQYFLNYFSVENCNMIGKEYFIIRAKNTMKDSCNLLTSYFTVSDIDSLDSFQMSTITLVGLIVFLNNVNYGKF